MFQPILKMSHSCRHDNKAGGDILENLTHITIMEYCETSQPRRWPGNHSSGHVMTTHEQHGDMFRIFVSCFSVVFSHLHIYKVLSVAMAEIAQL